MRSRPVTTEVTTETSLGKASCCGHFGRVSKMLLHWQSRLPDLRARPCTLTGYKHNCALETHLGLSYGSGRFARMFVEADPTIAWAGLLESNNNSALL